MRGQVITNVRQDGTLHIQKWPRKRGKATEGGALYTQLEFALAASWASDPEPIAYQSALNMSAGTDNVPRDLLMMVSYGTLFDIEPLGDITFERYRDVAPNAQYILDQVTDTPGSILYRAAIGWIGLPPGNNSFVLTMSNGVPLWLPASGGGSGNAQFTWFTTPGPASYVIPANVQMLQLFAIAGGGGGGSGRRTASGTAASGGGGGGGGAVMTAYLRVAQLPSALTLNIGAGGTGGAARTTDNQNGASGNNGGNTTVSNGVWTLTAGAGNGGGAGSTATSTGGSGGGIGRFLGGAGAASGVGSAGGSPAAISTYGSNGGGGGGGMPAAPAARAGGAGGNWAPATGYPLAAALGGNPGLAQPPETGRAYDFDNIVGTGGGGGGNTGAGVAQDGAAGGTYGGGGGGGAASLNGQASGAGGKGSDGAILFVAW